MFGLLFQLRICVSLKGPKGNENILVCTSSSNNQTAAAVQTLRVHLVIFLKTEISWVRDGMVVRINVRRSYLLRLLIAKFFKYRSVTCTISMHIKTTLLTTKLSSSCRDFSDSSLHHV